MTKSIVLDKLKKKYAELEEKIKSAELKLTEKSQVNIQKKQQLIGAWWLEKHGDNPHAYAELIRELNLFLKKNEDRAIFHIEKRPRKPRTRKTV